MYQSSGVESLKLIKHKFTYDVNKTDQFCGFLNKK